ncbi:hypothetical protein CAP36_03315 [Chitinophagaceae bacterium IBVUCB2]|nr:hypothetical protein CAP36_03315 [Chitinophagaceae bacterium IBVUCB2]
MQQYPFPVSYNEILERIDQIDPVQYATSRNFLDGAVTYLSPYISRGVISCHQIFQSLLSKGYTIDSCKKLIQELAWREYFQRVWQYLEDDIFKDIRKSYQQIQHTRMPVSLLEASTGIIAIDKGIKALYETGYMHNHIRMYTASITTNIGKAHWQIPSQWMYYHLLDGDIACNTCSWQWVAGTFSTKKYFCNQENINKYTGTSQQHTYLDKSYDELPTMAVPPTLSKATSLQLKTSLPSTTMPELDSSLPLLLYNSYNLDPLWHEDIEANRILLLEPSHFNQYPVSEKVIDFIMGLSKNIPGLQVMTGEVKNIPGMQKFPAIYSKEHPLFKHYPGKKDERTWLFPEVNSFPDSFFSYWKKCEKTLLTDNKHYPVYNMNNKQVS